MPRASTVDAITAGIQGGVAIGNSYNKAIEERRKYEFALAEAERKTAEENILAEEAATATEFRLRKGRKNVPGYKQDVEDLAAESINQLVNAPLGGPHGQDLKNIAYLALEQAGSFANSEKFIRHAVGVVGKLKDEKARNNYLNELNVMLELNAFESEKGKLEADLRNDDGLGLIPTPGGTSSDSSAGSASGAAGGSQPGNEQGQEQGPSPLVQGSLDALNEAWDESVATGDLGTIRAGRAYVRQVRATAQQAIRQAQHEQMMVEDREQRMNWVMSELAKTNDPEMRDLLLKQRFEISKEHSKFLSEGGSTAASGEFYGNEGEAENVPTEEELQQLIEQGSKAPGGAPAEEVTNPKDQSTISPRQGYLNDADAAELEAGNIEKYDPHGAAKLRKEAADLRRKAEKASDVPPSEQLTVALTDLGVTVDPFQSEAAAVVAIAELYGAQANAQTPQERKQVKQKIKRLFNMQLDKFLKPLGIDARGSNSIVSALTKDKPAPLNTIIKKFSKSFNTIAEAEQAFQDEGAQVQPQYAEEAGPKPAENVAAQKSAASAVAVPNAGIKQADIEEDTPDLPPGAAGGMRGGRKPKK